MAFHISVSLIWALIWLTESMLCLSSIDLMLILSLIFEEFSNLSSLFWLFCNCSIPLVCTSSSFHLIWLISCRPYQILEVNRPSLIFLRPSLFREFFTLLIRNILCLNEDIIPPFPVIWETHFWLSSKVMPSSFACFSCVSSSCPSLMVIGSLIQFDPIEIM